mgnify:FL=1
MFEGSEVGECRPCHPACKECVGPLATQCSVCPQNEKFFLWANNSDKKSGICIDCLDGYKDDNSDSKGRVCDVSRELEFVRNPWESVDRESSKSLKLRFMGIKKEKTATSVPAAAQEASDPPATPKTSEPEEMFGVVGRQQIKPDVELLQSIDWNSGIFDLDIEGLTRD